LGHWSEHDCNVVTGSTFLYNDTGHWTINVFGHNLLDNPSISDPLKGGMLADLTYFGHFAVYNIDSNHLIIVIYSFLPWTGVMAIGYCMGKWYGKSMDAQKRKKLLFRTGLAIVLFFIVLRFLNVYGDPSRWSSQPRGALYTIFSFLNTTKYPPSLYVFMYDYRSRTDITFCMRTMAK
jgi:uncharacterized membrane protein